MAQIEVENLVKHFGSTKAVNGISFSIEPQEIFAFLGPNGAGKTTTIRCMMDFLRPTSGTIRILGKDAQKDSVELKKSIGYLAGEVKLNPKWNGETHINFFKHLVGKHNQADMLIERLNFNTKIKSNELSSGNRQKLGIILALMAQPSILILDEPTTGLDPLLQRTVYELVEEARKNGATIFMSSHNLSDVEKMCDRVGIIKNGKMVAVESIASLKKKHLYAVRVTFAKHVEPQALADEAIEVVSQLDRTFVLKIGHNIPALIQKLAHLPVEDMEITHAGLEEIFMKYYQK